MFMSDALFAYQRALILLHVFRAPERKVTRSDLKRRLKTQVGKRLELDGVGFTPVADSLVQGGYLDEKKRGRGVSYALTVHGLQLLASSEQYPSKGFEVRLRVESFNELLKSARESQCAQADSARPTAAVAPATLADVIIQTFDRLVRDKYSYTGMVPIHEVRWEVGERFGPQAAGHEVFDALVQQLRRDGRIALSSISIAGEASAQELNDSIPGLHETLFYMERPHEPARAH
jgi:hypothetical protein